MRLSYGVTVSGVVSLCTHMQFYEGVHYVSMLARTTVPLPGTHLVPVIPCVWHNFSVVWCTSKAYDAIMPKCPGENQSRQNTIPQSDMYTNLTAVGRSWV